MSDSQPPTKKPKKPRQPKKLRKKFERKLAAQANERTGESLNPIGSRAPAREPLPIPPKNSPTSEKVAYCVQLMLRGQWRGYTTRHGLADVWGYTDDTVARFAAEAGRRFRLDPDQIEQEKIAHAMAFERIERKALRMRSTATGLPDFGSAIKARLEMAHFQGISEDPKRIELTGKGGGALVVTLEEVDAALEAAEKNAADEPERDPSEPGA